MAAMQAAITRTPSQPLMAHAFRSRITTRVPEGPTGIASGSPYGWTVWLWLMVPPSERTIK